MLAHCTRKWYLRGISCSKEWLFSTPKMRLGFVPFLHNYSFLTSNVKNSCGVYCSNINTHHNRKVRFGHSYRSRAKINKTKSPKTYCKSFCFGDYDTIGFDLDGTLLRYNLNEMLPLQYQVMRDFLVKKKNYPKELLDQDLDWDFMQKGLILDSDNGNIVKLSGNTTILRASHGTKILTDEEIEEYYGPKRQWEVPTKFYKDPLSSWNGPLNMKFRTLLDFFDMPAALVYGQAVDVLDSQAKENGQKRPFPYKIWPDILECLREMYSRDNYSNGKSSYFTAMQSDPERYVLKTSDRVLQWLQEFRAAGKSVFMLTGSNADFANLTATQAMGADWEKYFDCIICFGRKPGFYTDGRPFFQIENLLEIPGSEISLTDPLKLNSMYSQGNWQQLKSLLCHKVGKDENELRSLYVGDNLILDVYAPFKLGLMDGVAVCEELMADGNDTECNYAFQEMTESQFWGSYFHINNELTLWASIIAKYSQLCIPMLDTAVKTSIDEKLFCENTGGYYPKAPECYMV